MFDNSSDTPLWIVRQGNKIHTGYYSYVSPKIYITKGHAQAVANNKNEGVQQYLNQHAGYDQETGQAHIDAEDRVRKYYGAMVFYQQNPKLFESTVKFAMQGLERHLIEEPWEVVQVKLDIQ